MAKAKKLPSGQWRTLVYDYTDMSGKRHYESFTADNKRESEFMAAEFAMNKKDRKSKNTITFGMALDKYIDIRSSVLSPRTIMDYKRIRNKEIQDLMNVKICDITQELIQKIINEDSKKHSPKTVRNTHGLITAVLKQERPEFALNTVLPKKVRPNLYIPSDDEVQKLIAFVEGTEMELPILLAAFGPMRRGEICALDTDHINGNIVHIEKNMVTSIDHQWVIKQPKSYAGNRFIDFPDFVAEKWKDINGMITELTPDNITNRFKYILIQAGIPHFRFHDLRHYSASIQHALGIPDAYIMQRGGWGNDSVLKNVYRHTMEAKANEMNAKANEHFKNMQHGMQHKNKNP